MSPITRIGRSSTQEDPIAPDDLTTEGSPGRDTGGHQLDARAAGARETAGHEAGGRRRRLRRGAATIAAGLLVLLALLVPNEISRITPAMFLRIPAEALVGVGLVLVLPGRARRVAAVLAGVLLAVLAIVKVVDMGFFAILSRPFNPVLDWPMLGIAVDTLALSVGWPTAIAATAAAVLLAVALLVLMPLSVMRLTGLAVDRRTTATRTVTVLGLAWLICAVSGVQIVPREPVAARNTAGLAYDRAFQIRAGLRDRAAFNGEAAADAFRDTPAENLLTALRGKDVIVTFVESYGRDAVEDPQFAPQVGALLDAGDSRLRAAGFASRSAFLTSPTAGGASWLAHATLLSGLWIDNQQRYRNLVASDRLTLGGAFRRADWQTVAVTPAVNRAWPEADFFGYDRVYDDRNLGYRGPHFSYAPMPDQFALSAFERAERGTPNRGPLMAEIDLISSHTPWAPIPRLIGWDELGDGSVFGPIAAAGADADEVWRDATRVRTEYRRAIEYTLSTLISYVEKYGDDDLVLVFLGDHQPASIITGENASRDVPITILTRDRAVLDRISGWGWHEGLKPGPQAPVWRMNTFRDRFLTAFS